MLCLLAYVTNENKESINFSGFPVESKTHTNLFFALQPASFMSRLPLLYDLCCLDDYMFLGCIELEQHNFEPNRFVGKIKTHCMSVFLTCSSILWCSLMRSSGTPATARHFVQCGGSNRFRWAFRFLSVGGSCSWTNRWIWIVWVCVLDNSIVIVSSSSLVYMDWTVRYKLITFSLCWF